MDKSINILFLAANPKDTNQLRLDEEMRAIDQAIRNAEFRDKFDIKQQWAVRVVDLQEYLLRHKPDIVHFSGHGSVSSEIILENNEGNSQPVSNRALSQLFSLLKDNVRCVILNACYSEQQGQAIAEHIDCVIGMSQAIGDKAAISFATAFYQALGYGKDVKTAFELGCVQIDLEKLDEQDTPKLLAINCNPKEILYTISDKQTTNNAKPASAINFENSKQIQASKIFYEPETYLGESVGSYNLLKYLGSGYSGIVFRASHATLGREIALKIFFPLPASYERFYSIFKNGMRALAALEHPNIVYIFDFGETIVDKNQAVYIAMGYISGKHLIAWSEDLGKNEEESFVLRLKAAIQISKALQAAHETTYTDEFGFQRRGVLHGDIKPENVIVTNNGDVKLLDFLIVEIHRLLGLNDVPARLFRHSIEAEAEVSTTDTSEYTAPEHATEGLVTVQTDIYSLGILLSHLFIPRKNAPHISIKDDHLLPRSLKDLMLRMISISPDQRPFNMGKVVKTLYAFYNKNYRKHRFPYITRSIKYFNLDYKKSLENRPFY